MLTIGWGFYGHRLALYPIHYLQCDEGRSRQAWAADSVDPSSMHKPAACRVPCRCACDAGPWRAPTFLCSSTSTGLTTGPDGHCKPGAVARRRVKARRPLSSARYVRFRLCA
ncbi:hypothetical protein BN2476_1020009 [Paraburkholderia piptadeniae]|uniref:Uncharacterized protein n=1 Tax=Paraburkholderia piptadeniae TaxID=1701573 RepID=A0A1N7SUI3_9BURK|nr:hypothetical protein BN2476_1020009 [Paraburkholderia piptadeniae]